MHHRTITSLTSIMLVLTCAVICGCVAPDEQGVAATTTVPVERGWTQAAVALLELYALSEAGEEAYERFNGSVVSPDPLILSDAGGHPLHYRYYVLKNGEPVYAVQVSANKLLGQAVTHIGDFGYLGSNESVDRAVNGSITDGAASGMASTPVPSYGEKYTRMMLDCWEVEDAYAQGVARDAEHAGIDISRPLTADDQELIREILWENIRQREENIGEIEENYRVEL